MNLIENQLNYQQADFRNALQRNNFGLFAPLMSNDGRHRIEFRAGYECFSTPDFNISDIRVFKEWEVRIMPVYAKGYRSFEETSQRASNIAMLSSIGRYFDRDLRIYKNLPIRLAQLIYDILVLNLSEERCYV